MRVITWLLAVQHGKDLRLHMQLCWLHALQALISALELYCGIRSHVHERCAINSDSFIVVGA